MRGTKAKWLRKQAEHIANNGGRQNVHHVYKDLKAFAKPKPAIGKVVEPRRRKSTQRGLRNFLVYSGAVKGFCYLSRAVILLAKSMGRNTVLHPGYDYQTVAQFKVKEQ